MGHDYTAMPPRYLRPAEVCGNKLPGASDLAAFHVGSRLITTEFG